MFLVRSPARACIESKYSHTTEGENEKQGPTLTSGVDHRKGEKNKEAKGDVLIYSWRIGVQGNS